MPCSTHPPLRRPPVGLPQPRAPAPPAPPAHSCQAGRVRAWSCSRCRRPGSRWRGAGSPRAGCAAPAARGLVEGGEESMWYSAMDRNAARLHSVSSSRLHLLPRQQPLHSAQSLASSTAPRPCSSSSASHLWQVQSGQRLFGQQLYCVPLQCLLHRLRHTVNLGHTQQRQAPQLWSTAVALRVTMAAVSRQVG